MNLLICKRKQTNAYHAHTVYYLAHEITEEGEILMVCVYDRGDEALPD